MNTESNKRPLSLPFFSIGVTTYDRVEMLIETINSILAQTFTDFEVIVSNDNPNRTLSGESLGIDNPRVKFVNQPKNLGEFYNMQFLLKASRGRYFTWLADDDLYHPEFFLSAHRMLTKYNYPPCIFTSFGIAGEKRVIKTKDSVNADEMLMSGADFLRQYLQRKIKAIGVMGFFNRDYLMSIGGLEDGSEDGKGMFCEYMLLLTTGMLDKVSYINAPLIFYRSHENAWGIKNIDAEMYKRAVQNLIRKSIMVLTGPTFRASFYSFYSGFLSILRIGFINYFLVLRRSKRFSMKVWLSYLGEVWKYLFPLRKSDFYLPAVLALIRVWTRFTMSAVWQDIILHRQG